MKLNTIHVRLHFIEGILGSLPSNEDIYRDYIASKAPNAATIEEEVAAVGADGVAEKGMTVFGKKADGTPFLYDYHIKGFFKGACGALKKVDGTLSSKEKAFKKKIDLHIFPAPREIAFHDAGKMMKNERPLRASTPMGERVSLACSEEISAGAYVECDIKYLIPADGDLIREWLDYGELSGIGQWRNSGKGRFLWEELDDNGNRIGGNYVS